jgi:hypothetical protein
LTLTYIDHPEKAIEISEQNINKNKKDSVGSNQINITKSNYKANLKSPVWGAIGLFNLCVLIPCVDKYETEIDVTYTFKGKELEKEKIKGHAYLAGSALLLFPYSIFSPNDNDDKKIREKFENKIEPYIQSKLFEVEKKRYAFEESFAKELREYYNSKNKKCKYIYDFRNKYIQLLKDEQKEEIWNEFTVCIENRVKYLTVKNYSFLKSHFSKEIYFQYESSSYKLIDLFNTIYLYHPDKLKLDNFNYSFYKENNKKFYMKIQNSIGDLIIRFEIQENKINCISIESYDEINPRGWESIVKSLFQKFYEFPQNDNLWNWELIDEN